MKIKLHIVTRMPYDFTTVGYWAFDGLCNTGALNIYCLNLTRKRWRWAVIGHELIESLWCWIFHITTEACDRWDSDFEKLYSDGVAPVEVEPGDDPKCPYHFGHFFGCIWERFFIYATFANWKEYVLECERRYHEMKSLPKVSQKILP